MCVAVYRVIIRYDIKISSLTRYDSTHRYGIKESRLWKSFSPALNHSGSKPTTRSTVDRAFRFQKSVDKYVNTVEGEEENYQKIIIHLFNKKKTRESQGILIDRKCFLKIFAIFLKILWRNKNNVSSANKNGPISLSVRHIEACNSRPDLRLFIISMWRVSWSSTG